MDIIFDEISQFIVKKIINKQKLGFGEYFDLTNNKKYIVCCYDECNKLIVCQYCGRFNSIELDHGGLYGDDGEGYYFDLGIKDCEIYTKISVPSVPDCEYKFFELEENFDFNTIKNIYTFVIENLKSCDLINYNDVKLIRSYYQFDNEDTICDVKYEECLS